jgi:hypothetical protein
MAKPGAAADIMEGRDLFLLAGLPKLSFEFAVKTLSADKNRSPAKYRGAPAPIGDWGALYPRASRDMLLTQAARSLSVDDQVDSTRRSLPTPRRIFLLYVESFDAEALLRQMDFFCLPIPIQTNTQVEGAPHESKIAWRHRQKEVLETLKVVIDRAYKLSNQLKAMITDKTKSPLTLPAINFRFPHDDSELGDTYRSLRSNGFIDIVDDILPKPKLFDRTTLHMKAFKGSAYSDRFFEDARGRIFPPDPHHGKTRPDQVQHGSVEGASSESNLRLLMMKQRYRFGVLARDGDLHFDVQKRLPQSELNKESMFCAARGPIRVTGSHANVGINDVVWAPDGVIEPDGN